MAHNRPVNADARRDAAIRTRRRRAPITGDVMWHRQISREAVLLVSLLASCSWEGNHVIDPHSLDADVPTLKSAPAHKLTLSGRVADKYDLLLTAHYTTFNPECTRTINPTAGVSSQVIVLEKLPVQRGGDTYASTVEVDKYLPGRCRWTFYQVIYELWPKGFDRTGPPYWQWSESIGRGAAESTLERTLVCQGTESLSQKLRNHCNYPNEPNSWSRPRSGISKNVQSLIVNFH